MRRSGMTRATRIGAALAIAALIYPMQVSGGEKEVSIARMPHVVPAPATVQLQIRVQPRPENRLLRVSLESGAFYRSSELTLEGDRAAATHWLRWAGVPAGRYSVVVELLRSNGERRLAVGGQLEVIGVLTQR